VAKGEKTDEFVPFIEDGVFGRLPTLRVKQFGYILGILVQIIEIVRYLGCG
jgi:hypothetical protein